MNVEEVRAFCISKKASTESFPFDEVTLVFKVMGKMFALMSLEKSGSINLKCNPDWSIELREQYEAIIPGYHMNKKHWNTLDYSGDFPKSLLIKLIDHSYDLVVSNLSKKQKEELNN
ncbi:MAG: MmcQ/YjbR family DNA-binding protein [Flavobacteriales bacterium]|nr:MmcQ/YjbR family DNA-binding protein [Flavobacteriales bacterium]